ncbi:exo-alpha-sialidase [Acinetobacter baumannii]|uniref:exo-alpha-sialidase n=1 Tax=Acinetobacter baumannii TaxID=470 RepID=UPI001D179181|nr:exo-alpha-sialidase [Acinetobacter baumannii]MDO6881317.1 exo-alpha-sialidase [Acinetobacter baumannii]
MTVPISDRLSQLYVGNGTNTRFDFTFRVFDQEDATGIAVRKKGSTDFETVDPSAYVVTINPDNMGGYITFNSPPVVGMYFYIAGETPLDQLLDITNYDNFYPEALEAALDKVTSMLQERSTQLDLEKQARILADIHYDALAMEREENLENRITSYINAVIGITNPKIFDGITDRMVITEDGRTQREFNKSIPFWTNDYVAFKQETIQREKKIIDYADYENDKLDTALSLKISNETERAQLAEALLDAKTNANGVGNRAYKTYAEMDADRANIPSKSKVTVTNDPNEENNGDWQYDGTTFTKSSYDPKTQAINFAMEYIDAKTIFESGTDIVIQKDANGKTVYLIKKDGKFYIVGLPNDIASSINLLNSLIFTSNNNNLIEVLDHNGRSSFTQNQFGDLILPNVGNLTLALKALKNDILNQNAINLPSAHLSGKYVDSILTETMQNFEHTDYLLKASDVNALNIFPHVVTMLRIPAITRIGKSKYLLFFEARENSSDFGMNSQGVATVDINETTGVATISNVQCLHAAFTDSENKLRTFMNACAVKLDSGRIICLYVRRYSTTEHQLYKRYSDDDGLTWSNYEDITSVKGTTGWNLLCPCSQGLVKRYGQHKGRIVFPLWTSGTAYITTAFRSGYVYSDDSGVTWHLGEFADYASASEVQCAEDLNGDMLFSIRLENATTPKVIARHSDLTKKFTMLQTNKSLTSATVMSGLIQGENKYDKTANKFQLTACRTMGRTDLLIHTSYDGGENWRTHLLPSTVNTSVAYSCIENISSSKKFLLWESDSTTNFKYSVVALSNLVNEVN